MRISCPSCAAAYEVPDALIGAAPRQLRCARCGQAWTVNPEPAFLAEDVPPGPIGMPEPPPAPAQRPLAEEPEPEPEPRDIVFHPDPRPALAGDYDDVDPFPRYRGTPAGQRDAGAGMAWLLSVLLIAAGLAASYVWRAQIVAAWPPSGWIYLTLGLS